MYIVLYIIIPYRIVCNKQQFNVCLLSVLCIYNTLMYTKISIGINKWLVEKLNETKKKDKSVYEPHTSAQKSEATIEKYNKCEKPLIFMCANSMC